MADTKTLVASLVAAAGIETEDLTLGPTAGTTSAAADSPISGDHAFFTYCAPGATFQAHDGTYWILENISDTGFARIRNIWYPREEATVPLHNVRQSIYAWVEPIQQIVPPLSEDASDATDVFWAKRIKKD